MCLMSVTASVLFQKLEISLLHRRIKGFIYRIMSSEVLERTPTFSNLYPLISTAAPSTPHSPLFK